MNTRLSTYNNFKELALKDEVLSRPQTKQLFKKLDADNTLVGAGVIYIDRHYTVVRLREFKSVCRIKPIHVVIHEVPPNEPVNNYTVKLRNNSRPSRLMGESVSTLLSCSAAVLGWVVVFSGGVAAPITAGVSSVVSVLALSAATASSIQCVNGLGRTALETSYPDGNDWLDSKEWYQEATKVLDLVSLAGVGATGLTAIKAVQNLKKVSSRSTIQILKSMTRPERTRLSKELARVEVPGLSNKTFKRMVRSGVQPNRYSQHSINTALMLNLKGAVGATLSFSGSAFSGNIKHFVIGIYEEQN